MTNDMIKMVNKLRTKPRAVRTVRAVIDTHLVLMASIGAVILLLLVVIVGKFKENQDQQVPHQICKQSILANHLSHIRVKGFELFSDLGKVELPCNTRIVSIPKGKEFEATAKEMYYCYDQFGAGQWELFDTEEHAFCVVCAKLNYAGKGKYSGFTDYLLKNKVSKVSDISYFEFLTGYPSNDKVESQYKINEQFAKADAIDTAQPLAVVFVMDKTSSDSGFKFGAIGGSAGAGGAVVTILLLGPPGWLATILTGVAVVGGSTIGYFVGSHQTSADWYSTVLLYPHEKLTDLKCTRLEGKASGIEVVS